MSTVTLQDETDTFSMRYQTDLMLHIGDTVSVTAYNWKNGKTIRIAKAKIIAFDEPQDINNFTATILRC